MPIPHLLLALLVVVVWGCNFIFIKLGLDEFHPLFFCCLRFFLASVPGVFFVKPPTSHFKTVALYGLIMFGMQFMFLFMGLHVGMTAGMASLLVQTQVFFSIFFAVLFLKEAPNVWQIVGALISFTGIGLVALHLDATISLLGFIFIIGAAASWGVGNLVTKRVSHINTMSLVVWGSFVACFPMLLLSLLFEGPASIVTSLQHYSWVGGISVFYVVYISTWLGYGAWNWLLRHYPVSTVAPFTLLVPIIGIVSSALIFGETLQVWKIGAGILVIAGLCINLLGARYFVKKHLKVELPSVELT